MEIDQRGNVIIEYFPMKPEKSLAIFMQSAESGSDGKIADKVWRRVGQDVVQKARAYLVKNGSYITGDLYNSVKANVDKGQLELIADAKNRYGYAYGGSVEYGFIHHYSKTFVNAKPFLRPAIKDSTKTVSTQIGIEVMVDYLSKIGLSGAGGSFLSGFQSFGMKTASLRLAGNKGGFTRGTTFTGNQASTFKMAQRQTSRINKGLSDATGYKLG